MLHNEGENPGRKNQNWEFAFIVFLVKRRKRGRYEERKVKKKELREKDNSSTPRLKQIFI